MLIEVKGTYIETEGVIGIRDDGDYAYDEYYLRSVVMYKDGREIAVDGVSTKELANMINNIKVYEGKN